jgi:hypothetical protein
MSAWIKLEKALETDPRVLRAAKALARLDRQRAGAATGNASAFHYVTQVIGGLARLWIYADSHAREDDTLDLGFDELDELLGIPGFCSCLPPDWVVAIDENRVELPGFQAHNGVDARRRALTSKRVARHRETSAKRTSVSTGNAEALLDQTRLDQTRPESKTDMPAAPTARRSSRPKATDDPETETETDSETVLRVFEFWRSTYRHPQAKLDPKRRKLIRAALRNYSETDLCAAIGGYQNSPHHMGQNDRGTVYDSIELFLRDAKHIDAGLAFARNPPRTDLSTLTRANVDRTADWLPPEVRRNGG